MAHVLVIDNDASIRQAIRDILEDAGYLVHDMSFTPGTEDTLLQYVRQSPEPMVVLFDVGPFDVGLVNFLQNIPSSPDAPLVARHAFICLTTVPAHLPPIVRDIFARAGVSILAKPFDVDDLLDIVQKATARLGIA